MPATTKGSVYKTGYSRHSYPSIACWCEFNTDCPGPRYWIPSGFLPNVNISKKQAISHCVTCKKIPGLPFDIPDPPPLPKSRLQQAESFTVTGVGFTGALHIREAVVQRKLEGLRLSLYMYHNKSSPSRGRHILNSADHSPCISQICSSEICSSANDF